MSDYPLTDFEQGRVAANARAYKPDPVLDRAADLLQTDRAAWNQLHPTIRDLSEIQSGLREQYRAAVRAGLVPADRGSAA